MEEKNKRKRVASQMPEIIEDQVSLKNENSNLNDESEESFVETIKADWNLFWHGIIGDEENKDPVDAFDTAKIEVLTLEQIKKITMSLSQDRKKLNQKIEEVNKEIDLNSEKIESLKLVGGDLEGTVEHINRLNDIGQQLTLQLDKLNNQLKFFRIREDFLKSEKEESKR